MSVGEERALRYHRLEEEHIPALVDADAEAYPDPWTAGMFRQEIKNLVSEFFIVFVGDELAGYAGFWLAIDEAHITKITVLPAFRQQGLGHEIMGWLLRRAETMGANIARLEVRESNTAARALYAAHGFEQTGVRKGYYQANRESAIVMSRALRDH